MDYRTAAKALAGGTPWPVYVCYGAETFLMREFVNFAVDKLVDPADRHMCLARFDCTEIPLDRVVDEAETPPFFGSRKVVIAEKAFFLTAARENGKVEHRVERLAEYVARPAEHTVLILTVESEKLDERKKAVKTLKERGWTLAFEPLSEAELVRWAEKRAERRGVRMTPGALRRLVERTAGSLPAMDQEIEKLALYAGDGGIADEAAVDAFVPRTPEQNVFLLVDHVISRRAREAVEVLHDLLLRREEPIKLLALIARQCRVLLQVKACLERGLSQKETAAELGLHPYAVRLAAEQARKDSERVLAAMLAEASELDHWMKTGRTDKALGLELFLLRWARREAT